MADYTPVPFFPAPVRLLLRRHSRPERENLQLLFIFSLFAHKQLQHSSSHIDVKQKCFNHALVCDPALFLL